MRILEENFKNFGKIRNAFNEILVEGIIKNDNIKKKNFSDYLISLKKNEILKTQFLVYENIEKKVEKEYNKAIEYINENLLILSKFSKKEIYEANKKLAEKINISDITSNYELIKLHEDITNLIYTEKNALNIENILEIKDRVAKYIINNEPKSINEVYELPNSLLSSMLVNKFNQKYSGIDEVEKDVLIKLINANEDERKNIYLNMVNECIDLINSKLETTNSELKEKLFKVKDKLEKDKKDIKIDFDKLINLKRNLI